MTRDELADDRGNGSVPAPLDADSAAARRELLRRMLAQGSVVPSGLPIVARPADAGELPLSFAQQELWVIDQIDPGTIAFNLSVPPLMFEGPLDAEALARAIDAIVQRHEILRTTVATRDAEPVQIVAAQGSVALSRVDLSATPADQREAQIRRLVVEEMERPFDLGRGPLLRASLLHFDAGTHVLLLTMHHIVFDGVSMGLFIDELGSLYGAFVAGRGSPLKPLAVQYADFALAQRRWLSGAALPRHLSYWRGKLAGAAELRLPMERARREPHGGRTLRESVLLSPELSAALKSLGRSVGVTPFVLLLTAFASLMQRYSGQDDVVIGSPVTTRTCAEVESVIGFFVNMVVLRTDFSGKPGFREALRRVREVALGALEHADVPFDRVVRELGVHRQGGRNPLFQVAFAFESNSSAALQFSGVSTRLMRFHSDLAPQPAPAAVATGRCERPQADDIRRPPPEGASKLGNGPSFACERPQADDIRRPPPEGASKLGNGPSFACEDDRSDAPAAARLAPNAPQRPAMGLESAVSRFDIEAYARDEDDRLSLEMSVTELFGREALRQMLTSFHTLVRQIVADPDRPLAELPLLGEAERQRSVVDWNRTERAYPREACVHELFEVRARETPQAIAVEYGDERLSYAELNARANRLAHHLRSLGVGPEVMVGLSLERSAALVVAMLGILKAGGAYVPLDPEYPAERLAFMLGDTAAPVVVTQGSLLDKLPQGGARFVVLDRDWAAIEALPAHDAPSGATAHSLAYVIYTSGSTGTPKGVQVTHRSINRLVCNADYVQIAADDRVAQVSVVSFDAATFEIWGPLLNGARIVGVARDVALSPPDFARLLRERGITVMFLTTALFNQMAREAPDAFASLRCVMLGGEASDPAAIRKVLLGHPPRRLLHVYGPTEVTTFSTWHLIEAVEEGAASVPIGRPIANTTAYVLDELGQPLPVGVAGELWLGGDGVARGYLNRPSLSAQQFVPDRFSGDDQARLYRTGDWVRYRADGAIEFVGRRDSQVKVRGFRIELGEIESALRRLPQVQDSVVVVREDEPGDRRVVAYVVAGRDEAVPPGADLLRALVKQHLPDHLVPSAFVVLDKLPLNANGKVDKAALPAPHRQRSAEEAPQAPRSELEQRIAAIWCEMLQVDQVGINENFFDLGGHSLLLVRTHARLRAELQLECRVVDLFTYPTIASLADHLRSEQAPDPLAAQARERLGQRAQGAACEPIAIIGMAGRFPGASNVEQFWLNLSHGRESIRFFTQDEMREAGAPPELLADPDHVPARGYLEDADLFDAGFFGFSAREAEATDPQQRLLLECASELLDRAGVDPDRCEAPIGVFAGSGMNSYYAHLQSRGALPESLGGLSRVLASGHDFLTTRVSYKLNLHGPSLNVQTACSTSLVAVHLACRALAGFECDMALAGGVSVTVPLKSGHVHVDEGIGSRDGHCRAFDAAADGTVGGNGVAMVLLKRLSEALRDGDHIHAVIRGTAVNNDGSAKVGYTAPSVEGQAQAIALAQAAAQCPPESIQYVETHGTGTHLGDPIEIAALMRVFGAHPRPHEPCWLGALKSNVGHLDAAAGVAGLIKAALSIEHAQIAPSLHFEQPNPQIDFVHSPFAVNTELRPWQTDDGALRRAGVSSFGLGGTNAHAVLEQAPPVQPGAPARAVQLLCLSAKSAGALAQSGKDLARYLRSHPEVELADAAYTLQVGRREFAHRRVVVGTDPLQLAQALDAPPTERAPAALTSDLERSVVFLFSGQGSQYPGMGAGLYRSEPVFRDHVDHCSELLVEHLGVDLRTLMLPADAASQAAQARLRQTEIAQPALFTIEYATAQWWLALGVQPAAMIGHSIGEYVAACLAGVMSLPDALALVVERGRLMAQMPAGAMLSVALAEAPLRELLTSGLSLAAVNGPNLAVVAGPDDEIAALEAVLEARGLAPRRLQTSHAFHSSMMVPALEPFRRCVERVELSAPKLAYVSNVTGTWITPDQAMDPGYYVRHLRETVQFSAGIERLLADAGRVLLEVGPGTTLTALARSHPAGRAQHAFIASMRHPADGREDAAALLEAAGRLWLSGVRPDWAALHGRARRLRVILPTYPFERRRYWIDAAPAAAAPAPSLNRSDHPADWLYAPSWRRVPAPRVSPALCGRPWLVFSDAGGLGAVLGERLHDGGSRVASVVAGQRFARLGPDRFELRPHRRDDYDRLLADLAASGFTPEGIAHLWAVEPAAVSSADAADAAAADVERGFFSVVFLLQALDAAGGTAPLRLCAFTRQAVDVLGDELVRADRAMVLAPCKVVAMEQPLIRARVIDVCPTADLAAQARALADELCSPESSPVLAYRGRQRWAQGFEPLATESPAARPALLRDGASYLITGGLGGVGLELAGYLARRVEHVGIVLVGRSGLPPRGQWAAWTAGHASEDVTARRIRRVEQIEALGATVLVCQADVADTVQMTAVLEAAQDRFGAIAGVFHAAGAEKQEQTLAQLEHAACAAQWRPKIDGLRVLERVLDGQPLDFVLVQSSLASVLGVAGFASYTASHLAMDAFVLAHNRRGGTPWRCVNWDNWRIDDDATSSAARAGPAPEYFMRLAEAGEALDRVLARPDETQILVSSGSLQGRIDRWQPRADAAPDGGADEPAQPQAYPRPALSADYVAARTPAERSLVAIWQATLGIDRIGVHDNFFELGGDSVLNIQITGKAHQAGLRLTPKQVFEHQTIAELAAQVGAASAVAAPMPMTRPTPDATRPAGPVPLMPIQAWFLERGLARPQHFNLPLLLELRRPVDVGLLGDAMTALIRRHDALRLRFTRTDRGWQQTLVDDAGAPAIERLDFGDLDAARQDERIAEAGAELQRGLDLAAGPLWRAAHFDLGPRRPARLLLVVHHLVVDMISWRILLEDLQAIYAAMSIGRDAELPAAAASIRAWAEALVAYAATPAVQSEFAHWRDVAVAPPARLPVDHDTGPNGVASACQLVESLGADETRRLLVDLPRAHGSTINDALLLALATAVCDWGHAPSLLLDMEGHGREAIAAGVDASRTVGWFTTVYPVRIDLPPSRAPSERLAAVHRQLAAIPGHGMGFGVLRHLDASAQVRSALASLPPREISFLYLGQFDQAFARDALFVPVFDSVGPCHNPGDERSHLLEVNCMVSQGSLRMAWTYSRNRHDESTVTALAQATVAALRALLDTPGSTRPAAASPAAYSGSSVSAADLAEIARQMGAQARALP